MNIQIFGTKKSADTRKAERFFKERRIRFQFIDLSDKGISRGELTSVISAVGGIDRLIDDKDADFAALMSVLVPEQKIDKLLERQDAIIQPIVRNGRAATVGYQPEIWTGWQ